MGKVSKFQERLFNDNFKAGNGEERKGKGKLSVPPIQTIDKVGQYAKSCSKGHSITRYICGQEELGMY